MGVGRLTEGADRFCRGGGLYQSLQYMIFSGGLTILKRITVNDVIAGRAKYVQGAFDITKTGNVMIIANNPFFTKEAGNAIIRRVLLFPSNNVVQKKVFLIEPKSNEFHGPLAAELSGILA